MNYNKKSHIINVTRKPLKCPVCGSPIVDIIYGTGDMTEVDFVLEYRKEGIMRGDNIPHRPSYLELLLWLQTFLQSEF